MSDLEKNSLLESEIPFFMCPNEIFDKDFLIKDTSSKKERKLDCQEALILIYLIRCTNNGKSAFPSYNTIASKCKCSKRKAMYAIDNLVNNDFIIKKHRGYILDQEHQVNKNQSNVYKINHKKFK